jgi:hypothetical protein
MRYFVKIAIPVGVRWEIVAGTSACRVAEQVLQQISPEISAVFVGCADNPEDTFSDCDMESEESRCYSRAEILGHSCSNGLDRHGKAAGG